ncbi:MAG: c-type cytochrome [Betaproteobacteria bacterium]
MISYLVFCRTTTVFIAVVVFSLYSLSSFAADLEVGKAKAQVCVACHGPEGNSINSEFPSLSGQPAQAISTALFRFREGNRKNAVMSTFAANLSNRDMNDIAAYFASIKRVSQHVTQPVNLVLGPELAKKYNCTQCHGPELKGLQHIPRIAGQQHTFLITAIREFKAQTRSDMDGNMSSAASILSDADIVALADYIAALGDNSRP